jgi:hypothetical protein
LESRLPQTPQQKEEKEYELLFYLESGFLCHDKGEQEKIERPPRRMQGISFRLQPAAYAACPIY